MPDSLHTTISQFSSSGGRWQGRAANVRAVEPAPDLPSAGRGSLYMLAEVSGSGGGHTALYRQMLNAAQAAFYEKGETVDAALRQAMRSAHAVLRQANEGLPEAGWRAGMSLVARYGDRLTIARAGPGLVFVSHPRTVDQFPAVLGDWGDVLGGDMRPEVAIHDAVVEPGSLVLLAQSDWPQHVAPEALAVAAAAPNVSLAAQYLGQLAGNAELSALLVGFSSTIPELQEEPAIRPEPFSPPAAPAPGAGEAERVSGKGAPRPGGKLFGFGRTPEEPAPALPVVTKETADAPALPRAAESAAVTAPAVFPDAVETAAPVGEPLAPVKGAAPAAPKGRSPWPLVALAIIPLLILGLVFAMLFVRNRTANAEFARLLQGATAVITEVEGLPDVAGAQRLGAAREFLDKAQALRPEDQQLAQLEQQYQVLFDKVQHVIPLYGAVPLWTFQEPGHSMKRVLANGDSLFVLDGGRSEAYRFVRSQLGDSVTPTEKPVIRKGDQISGVVVSDLVDITWAEAAGSNQRSKLLTLDTANALFGYDTTWGTENLPLGGQDKLGRPQLSASYGGNLYVVDPAASQVWRYRPGTKGYEDAPEVYFPQGSQVDLTGVQAIAIDGHIWLLFADGRLLKFFGGEQRPFELQGLSSPLSTPTAIAVPLEGDRLYILDAGNGRIVEVTKEGQFLRQFRAREGAFLRDGKSLFLDEANRKFYILTPDQLYVADVPQPSASPAAAPAAPGSAAPTQAP